MPWLILLLSLPLLAGKCLTEYLPNTAIPFYDEIFEDIPIPVHILAPPDAKSHKHIPLGNETWKLLDKSLLYAKFKFLREKDGFHLNSILSLSETVQLISFSVFDRVVFQDSLLFVLYDVKKDCMSQCLKHNIMDPSTQILFVKEHEGTRLFAPSIDFLLQLDLKNALTMTDGSAVAIRDSHQYHFFNLENGQVVPAGTKRIVFFDPVLVRKDGILQVESVSTSPLHEDRMYESHLVDVSPLNDSCIAGYTDEERSTLDVWQDAEQKQKHALQMSKWVICFWERRNLVLLKHNNDSIVFYLCKGEQKQEKEKEAPPVFVPVVPAEVIWKDAHSDASRLIHIGYLYFSLILILYCLFSV